MACYCPRSAPISSTRNLLSKVDYASMGKSRTSVRMSKRPGKGDFTVAADDLLNIVELRSADEVLSGTSRGNSCRTLPSGHMHLPKVVMGSHSSSHSEP